MKILIAAIHYPVASGRYIARAFRRLGHDVRTVGPTTGNEVWGMKVKDQWKWMPEIYAPGVVLDSGAYATEVQAVLESQGTYLSWSADLIVTCDSAYTLTGASPCPHIAWGVDNHVRTYDFRKFDALFLAHSLGYRMGEPNVYHLPCAYDPLAHYDTGGERDIDVLMVGVPYEKRCQILDAMLKAGIVAICATGLLWDDYNAAYNRAKIALVSSACGDLAQRFFENMAQGCCVLADRVQDAPLLGFHDQRDYWGYDTTDEAVAAAKFLLGTGEYRRIAARGKQAVQGHTWDARAKQLLETMGLS